jgi:PIN domain nuclease of toxin-antitoxin system
MAQAVAEGLPVVTADRSWAGLSVSGLHVELMRE